MVGKKKTRGTLCRARGRVKPPCNVIGTKCLGRERKIIIQKWRSRAAANVLEGIRRVQGRNGAREGKNRKQPLRLRTPKEPVKSRRGFRQGEKTGYDKILIVIFLVTKKKKKNNIKCKNPEKNKRTETKKKIKNQRAFKFFKNI